jgi:hypothetical protein
VGESEYICGVVGLDISIMYNGRSSDHQCVLRRQCKPVV